jgi:hypothetical protein
MQAAGCILFAAYALAQILASFAGFEFYTGPFLAAVIVGGCIWFRFTLPLTIAAFLGAKNVWQWHWFVALIFAAPGLLLVIPSILGTVVEQARHGFKR